jgi:P27 family predicted phage terminase small subunit
MKQRGRKSQTQLRVVGSKPKLGTSNNPGDPPRPPNHLGEPEQQIWNAVIGDWKGNGASYFVLLSGLEAHQRAREAREIIDDEGMTIIGRDGQPKAHPLCTVERDARRAFQQTFRSLGIKL